MILGHAHSVDAVISASGCNIKRGRESPDAVNDLLTS